MWVTEMDPKERQRTAPGKGNRRKNVRILKRKLDGKKEEGPVKKLRVAAYCRVSTELASQEGSLKQQMNAFQRQISRKEEWELAGVYTDDGYTGTQAMHRQAFKRMIRDCEEGKIDYILTKSISRFARNTLECLSYIRRLREIGVSVYFEKENLDTGNPASEMILSILAAVAQEESRNISENVKWSQQKRFAQGISKWSFTYGYKKENGVEFLVDQKTAPVVRRIFEEYDRGLSLPQIARSLEEEGILSPQGGRWYPKVLAGILGNEKYVGDAMLQKSCTVDHLTHRRMKNDQTKVPSYYVRDHHEAIVDRRLFERVQVVRSLKDRHKGSVQYPYFQRIRCPFCGGFLVRSCMREHGRPAVWHCRSQAFQKDCGSYYIYEKYIDQGLKKAYVELDKDLLERRAKAQDQGRSAAALEGLWMKREKERLDKIEYYFLDIMVEDICFWTWDKMTVNWKCGLKSSVGICYQRNRDIPGHQEQAQAARSLSQEGVVIRRTNLLDQNSHNRLCYYGTGSTADLRQTQGSRKAGQRQQDL